MHTILKNLHESWERYVNCIDGEVYFEYLLEIARTFLTTLQAVDDLLGQKQYYECLTVADLLEDDIDALLNAVHKQRELGNINGGEAVEEGLEFLFTYYRTFTELQFLINGARVGKGPNFFTTEGT